ncbi:MAG TPA: type III-B CRISPR module-associated protein Cmr5 [Saprospiraceae bacterium]|nr:type III-B CRISPR module-associated protein Cmr5 [Saprospiraceae bacterium]
MNQKIKDLIPKAMDIIEKYESKKGTIDKEVKGYISSLGAGILMAGLLPTLAVYAAEENNSQASRHIVLDWINQMIRNVNKPKSQDNAKELLVHVISLKGNTSNIELDILNASIALKLSIRTFKLTD